MTVPTRRLLPLACTLWILALFAVSPNARETSRSREQHPHPDLSLFTHSDNCLSWSRFPIFRVERSPDGGGRVVLQDARYPPSRDGNWASTVIPIPPSASP